MENQQKLIYEVVTDKNLSDFLRKVNDYINNGWKLAGSMTVGMLTVTIKKDSCEILRAYYQPVTKEVTQ